MVTGVTGPTMTANVIGSQVPTIKDVPQVKGDRRSNKPIMEKRRRARINNCLNELKTLILDATKKDPARHSKLEKADILEKTVKHLQELQRQQAAMQQAADPKIINKFKAGFADCANEVSRFPGLDPAVKRRLLQHLSNCINGVKIELHHHQRQVAAAAAQAQQIHAQMLPSPPSSPEQDQQHQHHLPQQQQQQQQQQHGAVPPTTTPNPYMMNMQIQHTVNGYFLPNGMQVIPTKLPNGSIALVLPQSLPQHVTAASQQPTAVSMTNQISQPPMLVPVPSRTASTGSASSHSSSSGYERLLSPHSNNIHYAPPSPANSFEAMDCKPSVIQHASNIMQQQQQQQLQQQQQRQQQQYQQQIQMQMQNPQPLSLVMKKQIKEEEQPWRPW